MKAFYLFFCFFPALLTAQTMIQGQVTDPSGEAIIGANVYLQDTYDGASSDLDGHFSFSSEERGAQTLVVSYLGFETYQDSLTCNTTPLNLTIQLQPVANELTEVVISAGAFEASDERKGVVLNALDIVTTAGATGDTYGALNTLPGTQTVGEEGRLFVRGGAASETRTFIDGLLVQSPYNSSVPNIPARGRFSPFLFKGTMFSTGGYSAEYGQALSSALILNTQDLATESLTSISLMSVGASVARAERWDNSSLSVSGGYTNLAPYTALVKQNIDWLKPVQSFDGQVIYRKKTSETGIFKANLSSNRSWFSLRYPDANDIEQLNDLSLTNDNYYANLSYRELLNDKTTLFSGIAYSLDRDRISELFNVRTDEQSLQAKTTLSYHASDAVRLKTGVEYLFGQFDQRFQDRDEQVFETDLPEHYAAAFAEADIYLTKGLVARVGARGEYSKQVDNWNAAPRLSMAYKTGENAQVSFAYGQFYQNPEKDLLRYDNDLGFERADHYMANYQWINNNYIFRVEAYEKRYHNLVNYTNGKAWEASNSGNGHARGIDVFFRDRKSIKNGDYWVSYSFLDTEREYRDFPEASTPGFASKHNLSLVYKHWMPQLNMLIGGTYSFASGRPYDNPNSPAFNAERTKAFNDLSLNVSYLRNIMGNFTIFHFSVTNVLGFENTFGQRFSALPNDNGVFSSTAIEPPAKRFFFVGMFMSIGKKYDRTNPEN